MKGQVVWITGLSGAGKTTVANGLKERMLDHGSMPILLDGDILRSIFEPAVDIKDSYGRKERVELSYRYAQLCKNLSMQGFTVIIATISMFNEIYSWNRKNLPGYFEIFLNVPMQELLKRDPKDIYKKFYSGEIINVAGLDLEVDTPSNADLLIAFEPKHTPTKIVDIIMEKLMLGKQI